jgi:hypothetical protein
MEWKTGCSCRPSTTGSLPTPVKWWMLHLEVLSCPLHLLKLLTLWKIWRPIKLGTRNVNPARKKEECTSSRR